MKTLKALLLACLVASATWAAGCVPAGGIQPNVVNRYEAALLKKGVETNRKKGPDAFDLLRPTAQPGIRPLTEEPVVNRETFKTVVVTEKYLPPTMEAGQQVHRIELTTTTTTDESQFTGEPSAKSIIARRHRVEPVPAIREVAPNYTPAAPITTQSGPIYDRVGRETWTPSLTAASDKLARLDLEGAIQRCLNNSLDIRVAGYDPAVAREQMTQAAAAFDYILFGDVGKEKTDKMSNSTVTPTMSDVRKYELGVKQKTITGAEWSLAYSLQREWDNSAFSVLPRRYEPQVICQITQPLLRNAWPEYNLANLRIARLNRQSTEEAFRQKVEETLNEMISTYWQVVQTRRDYNIQADLLDMTIRTRDRIEQRMRVDATQVELKQAEAAVAVRKASLIVARKAIEDAQDRLGRLLGDPQINALVSVEIIPTDAPITVEVRIDPEDQLKTALLNNPQLAQARLAIAAAVLNVKVARNQTLPKLDLSLSFGWQGLAHGASTANDNLEEGDFLSHSIALNLEYPIGNRLALAQLAQRQFENEKAVATMQNVADQLAVLVTERVRQVHTSFDELKAQQEAVAAAQAELDALESRENIRGQLSPAFLQTKLQSQETLANSQRAELQATIDYNTAQIDLARATGTVLKMNSVKLVMPKVIGDELQGQGEKADDQTKGPAVQSSSIPTKPGS